MSENDQIEAFNEGYHAYQIEDNEDSNPYPEDSILFKEWLLGYKSASIDKDDEEEDSAESIIH